jgi:hypothetical protein
MSRRVRTEEEAEAILDNIESLNNEAAYWRRKGDHRKADMWEEEAHRSTPPTLRNLGR